MVACFACGAEETHVPTPLDPQHFPVPEDCSQPSATSAVLTVNIASGAGRHWTYRLTESCTEEESQTANGGESITEDTFVGDVWRIRDDQDNLVAQVEITSADVTVAVP